MKKHTLLITNTILSIIILIGFILTVYTNYTTFKTILEDDIENISKLTSSTIYAEIDNELTKPIFVSQTMANDTFLKTWLYEEKILGSDPQHTDILTAYLSTLQQKYNYDSVFLISSHTNIYYHYHGINKIVSPDNAHDVWYYTFLAENQVYDLNVDVDEANQNELTVFVDCRIEDERGNLLGVVGVGVKMNELQQILGHYEKNYDLQATLINKDGLVQVHTDTEQIEKTILFSAHPYMQPYQSDILENKQSMEVYWLTEENTKDCLITRYIDNLDWYLIVQKNTEAIAEHFHKQFYNDFLIVSFILILLLCLSTLTISRFNKIILHLANTDKLTGLPNLTSFRNLYLSRPNHQSQQTLFIFDIDNFKLINDTLGHLTGNTVLLQIGQLAKSIVAEHGLVARFGGDEFIGILWANNPETIGLLHHLLEEANKILLQYQPSVTISIGVVFIQPDDILEDVMQDADNALYSSKKQGKNRITFYEPTKSE